LDEANPPIGGLEAASRLGRSDYNNLIVFSSLSKRSNSPGLRSGYVAGDAEWIAKFLKYRTYHGSAMSVTIQKASIAAWDDESHVIENRRLYKEKFDTLYPMLNNIMGITMPPAGFYFWANVGRDDAEFVRDLYKEQHVTLLPGSYLGREQEGLNPGSQHVRIALVAPLEECVEAAKRIRSFVIG
jgi:N-succinyldiaminopimelate aminotransferase